MEHREKTIQTWENRDFVAQQYRKNKYRLAYTQAVLAQIVIFPVTILGYILMFFALVCNLGVKFFERSFEMVWKPVFFLQDTFTGKFFYKKEGLDHRVRKINYKANQAISKRYGEMSEESKSNGTRR